MIEFLFLDLDDTILDFHRAERVAITETLKTCGIDPVPEILDRYSRLNLRRWQMLERGEITRQEVKVGRFADLFGELGVAKDPVQTTTVYEEFLSQGHYFLPGAKEAVARLSKKYRLFLASNGTAKVQAGRLTSANLYRFFEQVFISEEIGHNKPSKEFFDACFARIPGFDPAKAVIVGDSLTSDIRGGNNAGIRTCWVNSSRAQKSPEFHVDYEIENLSQLEKLLEA